MKPTTLFSLGEAQGYFSTVTEEEAEEMNIFVHNSQTGERMKVSSLEEAEAFFGYKEESEDNPFAPVCENVSTEKLTQIRSVKSAATELYNVLVTIEPTSDARSIRESKRCLEEALMWAIDSIKK